MLTHWSVGEIGLRLVADNINPYRQRYQVSSYQSVHRGKIGIRLDRKELESKWPHGSRQYPRSHSWYDSWDLFLCFTDNPDEDLGYGMKWSDVTPYPNG
jgi:hypothetical protein